MLNMLKNLLSHPFFYSTLQKLVYKKHDFLERYVPQKAGLKILDIGCGPADVLERLPNDVEYHGYDFSEEYIKKAEERYVGRNAHFRVCDVNDYGVPPNHVETFDIVFIRGVLHHLEDDEVKRVFSIAQNALRGGGVMLTADVCRIPNQHFIAKWMADHDRGKYVRTVEQYNELVTSCLGKTEIILRSDVLRIPFNIVILRWIKNGLDVYSS